ncbi:hypothetical protein ALC57_05242 [Trachymyrmex cornetzi]|uniref:MADF domain-containing protein n=1 Tax=Trachymyrmex cornetzi TaxID=471704 RepID=A0A151JB45_9HYME|nr:hypothetical protein ALC57_05242 [Trachymyrmex cornetzi]
MSFINLGDSESGGIDVVYTCSICETICHSHEVRNHPCLEGFQRYHIDKNLYFHPQCDNGSIIRKSLVRGQEVFVEEEIAQEDIEQERADQEENEVMERNIDIEDNNLNSSDRPINLPARKVCIEELLIEEVRKRPPLWNYKLHISKRGGRAKEKLWEEIADSMKGEMTVQEIKKKWKSLSDMFRRLRRSHKQPSGSSAAKKIKWLHFDRLSFLHDMQRENVTTSNISDLSNSPDVSQDNTEISVVDDHGDKRSKKLIKSGAIMDKMMDLMNEPISVDVTGGLPNDEFTAFGTIVASKLRALSANASEVAMLAILQLLRETRVNNQ